MCIRDRIVEREREIHAFKSEAAYRVIAVFLVPDTDGKLVEMKAVLSRRIKTKEEAKAFLNACQGATFTIEDISTRPVKKTSPAPFTTSTDVYNRQIPCKRSISHYISH